MARLGEEVVVNITGDYEQRREGMSHAGNAPVSKMEILLDLGEIAQYAQLKLGNVMKIENVVERAKMETR